MTVRAQSPYGVSLRATVVPFSGQLSANSWQPPSVDGGSSQTSHALASLAARGMSLEGASSLDLKVHSGAEGMSRSIVTPLGRATLHTERSVLPPQPPNSAPKETTVQSSMQVSWSKQASPRMTFRSTAAAARPLSFMPATLLPATSDRLESKEQPARASSRATSRAASPRMRSDSHSPARPAFYSRSSVQTLQAPAHMTTSSQDYIHHHVAFLLQKHRDLSQRHIVERRSMGCYLIDGTEVVLEWQNGALVVVDGPLRQPFVDYLMQSEVNAEYDTNSIAKTSALHHVPKERRMTFDDTHKQYSRLEAMRVAKEQASIREKAADYVRDGKQVPDELVRKYNKALRSKLRTGRVSNCDASPEKPVQKDEAADWQASTPRNNFSARKEASSQMLSMVPPLVAGPPATQYSGAGQSVTATPFASDSHVPMMALITHRGISLNGLPSYAPPPMMPPSIITRSWSGTAIPQNGMMQVSHMAQPAAVIMATSAMQGAAVSSSTVPSLSSAPLISAVPVVQGQAATVKQGTTATTTTTTITYSSGGVQYGSTAASQLSARGAQASWLPVVQQQHTSGTQLQAWPMSALPPSRPVAGPRPNVKGL